jgi:predicted nucleic acid-binding protein
MKGRCAMRIYLDNCCLNRPYDDLSDDAVRMEAEAVMSIIDRCESGEWKFLASDVLLDEISMMFNLVRMQKVLMLYDSASRVIELTDEIMERAKDLEQFGIRSFDALHVASAELGGADVLLTTDRRLTNAASRADAKLKVQNPLKWLTEVFYER